MTDKTVIDKLTPEQEAKLPEYRDKWEAIAKSCEPLNLEKSVAAIKKSYDAIKQEFPRWHIAARSPIEGLKTAYIVDTYYDEIFKRAEGLAPNSEANLNQDQWRKLLDEYMQMELDKDVNILAKLEPYLGHMIFGSHDAHWLAYYDFFHKEVQVDILDKLHGLIEIAEYCGWYQTYEKFIVYQDRHCELHLNEDNELHNTSGPAIMYPDEWSIWRIEGEEVNEQIVMRPETLDPLEIAKEENLEIRRIMCQQYGWEKWLIGVNAEPIDARVNDIEATREVLYKFGNEKYLHVTCKTKRAFVLEVPPETKTCLEAKNYLDDDDTSKCVFRT